MFKTVGLIGYLIVSPFTYTFNRLVETYRVLMSFPVEWRHGKRLFFQSLSLQVYFTAIQALPLIFTAALVLGTATIAELATILPTFGAGEYIERLTVLLLVRELIPIITALIIIGRSGTAMATELGDMKLNREIDLLDSLGINIDYFLILPRLIGTLISMFCLTIVFDAVAIGGGIILTKIATNVPQGLFFNQFVAQIHPDDVLISSVKAALFGGIIAVVNCFQGLSVQKSFTEVPQATTRGVVHSMVFCFIINVIISILYFPKL